MSKRLRFDKNKRVIIPNTFSKLSADKLIPGDILLHYGSNKLTIFHGRNRSKKYKRATRIPTHANIFRAYFDGRGLILDTELRSTLSYLKEYLNTGNRIDVVRFTAQLGQRTQIVYNIDKLAEEEGRYDIMGYGFFLSQMPYMGWIERIIKPSKNRYFCSDAVTHCVQHKTNIMVSSRSNNHTAPVDLLLYGMQKHTMYTLEGGA